MQDSVYILTSDGELHSQNELRHHGVKGQKWGIRRYQNKDGSLTEAGQKRKDKTIAKINESFDKSNAYAQKAAEQYEQRGKVNKASIMRDLIKRNEKERKEITKALKKMDGKEFQRTRNRDIWWSVPDSPYNRHANMLTDAASRSAKRAHQRVLKRFLDMRADQSLDSLPKDSRVEVYLQAAVFND